MTRVEKLQKHLKSRRGRRDFQALNRLVDLKTKRKPGTLRSLDAILKCYYTEEMVAAQAYVAHASLAFFRTIKKDL